MKANFKKLNRTQFFSNFVKINFSNPNFLYSKACYKPIGNFITKKVCTNRYIKFKRLVKMRVIRGIAL